jgi:hypothetical protein
MGDGAPKGLPLNSRFSLVLTDLSGLKSHKMNFISQ